MAVNRVSWLMRIDSDPVCYLWTGFGSLETPADSIDASGATWLGASEIVDIPSLKALVNGIADRVTFTLSGVNSETLRLALDDKDSVKNADVRIGRVSFDSDWQLDGGVTYEWFGVADAIKIASRYGDNSRIRSIMLLVASADTTRSNPRYTYWTDAAQKLRSGDDLFCDHVADISRGVTRRFGPK